MAYLLGVHGLTALAKEYLSRVSDAAYWSESDSLASQAINSNDPAFFEKIETILGELLHHEGIAGNSLGIIYYNIARIKAAKGDKEGALESLRLAREKAPEIIELRLKIDPVLRDLQT